MVLGKWFQVLPGLPKALADAAVMRAPASSSAPIETKIWKTPNLGA
jgi:hypothetical protein